MVTAIVVSCILGALLIGLIYLLVHSYKKDRKIKIRENIYEDNKLRSKEETKAFIKKQRWLWLLATIIAIQLLKGCN